MLRQSPRGGHAERLHVGHTRQVRAQRPQTGAGASRFGDKFLFLVQKGPFGGGILWWLARALSPHSFKILAPGFRGPRERNGACALRAAAGAAAGAPPYGRERAAQSASRKPRVSKTPRGHKNPAGTWPVSHVRKPDRQQDVPWPVSVRHELGDRTSALQSVCRGRGLKG